jgi:hypothetical protein
MKSFIYIVLTAIALSISGCKCADCCSYDNAKAIETEVESHDTYKPWWAK